MNYLTTYSNDPYIAHWGFKKGAQKDDHKYSFREWVNGKWKYYYGTMPDKNKQSPLDSVTSAISAGSDKVNSVITNSKATMSETMNHYQSQAQLGARIVSDYISKEVTGSYWKKNSQNYQKKADLHARDYKNATKLKYDSKKEKMKYLASIKGRQKMAERYAKAYDTAYRKYSLFGRVQDSFEKRFKKKSSAYNHSVRPVSSTAPNHKPR